MDSLVLPIRLHQTIVDQEMILSIQEKPLTLMLKKYGKILGNIASWLALTGNKKVLIKNAET